MTDLIDQLIQELGDICHEHYLGCGQNKGAPDGYEYSYDNEVINLLNTPEAKTKLTRLLLQERISEASHYCDDGHYHDNEKDLAMLPSERLAELQQQLKDMDNPQPTESEA